MSLAAELFKLIETKKYSEALMLTRNSEELDINATDATGRSFLMAAIDKHICAPQERYAFMEYILARPDFQHANKSKNGFLATPFEKAIVINDPQAIELLIKYKDTKNIQVFFAKDKLRYELQAQEIEETKIRLENTHSAVTAKELDKQQQILASLLHSTVLHAIKTDDPSLLQRLVEAGAKLYLPLKNRTYPMDLVRDKSELKVHQWLSTYIEKTISSTPTFFFAAGDLAQKKEEEAEAIVQKSIQSTKDSILSLFKFCDYPDALPAAPTASTATAKP